MSSASPLHAVLDRVAAARDRDPVVVLDLDSTLLCNAGRSFAILRDYAAELPFELAMAKRIPPRRWPWGPKEVMKAARLDGPFADGFYDYWFRRFFSNEYLIHDRPTPGAVAFVRRVREAGARVMYMTGRSVEAMGEGTVASLRRWGFPLDERAELHLKPDPKQSDLAFKTALVAECSREHVIAAFIDDIPETINAIAAAHPEILVLVMDTPHAPEAPDPDPRIPTLVDFRLADPDPRPFLAILSGLPATGKSTVARLLAFGLGAKHLSTDHIRDYMFPDSEHSRESKYSAPAKKRVYDRLFEEADEALAAGRGALLDGTFLLADRSDLRALADRHGARLLFAKSTCSDAEVERRFARRADKSDHFSQAHIGTFHEMRAKLVSDPRYGEIDVDSAVESGEVPLIVFDTEQDIMTVRNGALIRDLDEILLVDFPLYRREDA